MKHLFIVFMAISCFSIEKTQAQKQEPDLSATILTLDSAFWKVYNKCDTTALKNFFTSDLEFYHDKGGVTYGFESMYVNFKKNLCSNPDFRLRREEVKGTVRVFPLKNGDKIYGAILSGEHVFYILKPGEKEKLDGKANFTHVWLYENNEWSMSRILSYDHRSPDK